MKILVKSFFSSCLALTVFCEPDKILSTGASKNNPKVMSQQNKNAIQPIALTRVPAPSAARSVTNWETMKVKVYNYIQVIRKSHCPELQSDTPLFTN